MIGTIRKNFSKQAFNIVIWVTLFSLGGGIFVGGLFRRFSKAGSTDVASVNGYEIGIREFQRKVHEEQRRESYMRQQFGPNAALFLEALGFGGKPEDRALKALIEQKLLLGVADRLKLALSPEYVSSKLEDPYFAVQVMGDLIPAAAITPRGINYRDLLTLLQRQGVPARCLEEIVEERIKGQLVAALAQGSAYVSEVDLREDYDKAFRGKKLLIIKIPAAGYLNQAREEKINDLPAILTTFFQEANKQSHRYWSPEKRTGIVWTFNHVPEGFLAEAQRALRSGKQPDELIKKYQGTQSPIGPTERTSDVLTRRLFELKTGEHVAFVDHDSPTPEEKSGKKDTRGFIVQLATIEPSAERPFDEVKSAVEHDYYLSKAAEALAHDLSHLKELAPDKRSAWVKEHHARESVTGFLAPDKKEGWQDLQKAGAPGEGIKSDEIAQLLSMSEVGEKKTVLTPQAGYLVAVQELEPFDTQKFNEKRGQLFAALMNKESMRVVKGFIASLEKNATIKTNKSFFSRR